MTKGQSAIEYLMTYGWMLLVVAVVGGGVFAFVGDQSVESVSSFSGGDILVEDAGLTSNNELELILRNGASNNIEIKSINVSGGDGHTVQTRGRSLNVGGTGSALISNIADSDGVNDLSVEIVYDSGGLKNLMVQGSISGSLTVDEEDYSLFSGGGSEFHRIDPESLETERVLDSVNINTVWGESGGFLYAGTGSGSLLKINPRTMEIVDDYNGHSQNIVEVWGDEDFVYTGSNDEEVHKIDKIDMNREGNYSGHGDDVWGIWAGEDFVYTGSRDNEVHKVNKSDMRRVDSINTGDGTIRGLTGDSDFVYSGHWANKVNKLNKSDLSVEGTYYSHEASINDVWSSDGFLFSSSGDEEVHKVDKSDMSNVANYTVHSGDIYDVVAWEGFVFSGSDENEIHKIDNGSMSNVGNYTRHSGGIGAVWVN